MLHYLYFASLVAAIVQFALLFLFYNKKFTSGYYISLFAGIILTSLGSLQMSYATTLQSAIYAVQITYLGGSFVPLFSLLCIADLTKAKIHWSIKAVCFAVSMIIVCAVSTVGTYPIYYKSLELSQANGISVFLKQYGPLHVLFPVYMCSVSIGMLVLIIFSYFRHKQISYRTSVSLFIILIISLSAYFIQRILHLPYEIVPFAENIQQLIILLILRRINLYDTSGISIESITESGAYGFISFKANGKFIGADSISQKWFPEISKLAIDKTITQSEKDKSQFLRQISDWLEKDDHSHEPIYFDVEDKVIEATCTEIDLRSGKPVHIIFLRDDTEQQKLNHMITEYNNQLQVYADSLEKIVDEKTKTLRQIQNDINRSMADIVENRDGNTGGHVKRTSDVVNIFVKQLMESPDFPELDRVTASCIKKAAPLHDFGKIAIPDHILNKPGKFTDEEYAVMKTHPDKGAVIVAKIFQNSDDKKFINIAINVAHYHHEKWDGSGYPKGLKETEIPFEARVMALADVFDALVSKRVYKDKFSYDAAFKIIEDSCGKHFDPVLCREFLKCRSKLEKLYNSYED